MQDIKPLLVFAAVLEHSSMNGAAQALGMTPSAVSQHITRLESLHGIKLLNRSTRRLTPTEAGHTLGQHCRRLRQSWLDAHAALDGVKEEAAGDVRLAVPTGMASAPAFQAALHRLAAEYPQIRLHLHFGEQITDLQQGAIDIALRGGDHALDAPDLVARPLARWRWQICAAPQYLVQAPAIHAPADLLKQRWLHYLPVRTEMARGSEHFWLEIDNSLYCNQLSAVHHLTLAGLGLALMVEGEIAHALADGRLQHVLPDWQLPEIAIYAVTPHRVQAAKVAVVLHVLQESFA